LLNPTSNSLYVNQILSISLQNLEFPAKISSISLRLLLLARFVDESQHFLFPAF